jgi:hypothetical protein
MKTRVSQFGQLGLSLMFCLGLASCNQSDFYEKEYLENPFQDPTSTGTANGGGQGGVDAGMDGGTQGGVQGGINGGTNGGATTGFTSGGTDGTSTGGTNGSGTGGSDGSSGGSSGGYDCSQDKMGVDSKCKLEKFQQTGEQTKKLDIVWIIDNSGSMADEQAALGLNFDAFIQDFITKNVDFKMAITTTDTRSSFKGLMVPGSEVKLNSTAAQNNPQQFMTDFRNMVKVGTSGSGNEKGLEASEGFMQRYAATFIRQDAYLAVVILSDEEDQSPKAVTAYTDYLKSFKDTDGLVKIYTIADIDRTNFGSGITVGAARYIEASRQTAGVVANIRGDFHRSLSDMGDNLINLLDSFALAQDPVADSLRVYVNGTENLNYTFDAQSRSIKFDPTKLPPVGAEIKVYYVTK